MPTPKPQPRKTTKATTTKAKKPAAKPGDGLLGWLGRQVGHVKHAVKADVTPAKPKPTSAAPKPATGPKPAAAPAVLYRNDTVEEVDHPTAPGLKLRRTTIDEVIAPAKIEPKGE